MIRRLPSPIFQCVMVYPDGVRETLPRYSHQVFLWTRANKTFHPKAALFVDGKCVYKGQFSDEEITKIEGELK